MNNLIRLLKNGEDWMGKHVFEYAKEHGYTQYAPNQRESWRLSVKALSQSLVETIRFGEALPPLGPDEVFAAGPVVVFGVEQAKTHRERGITLSMFLGLFKFYRRTYRDYLRDVCACEYPDADALDMYGSFLERCFDRIEIAFCNEWADESGVNRTAAFENAKRSLTNEKNAYLSVFESLVQPVIILRDDGAIQNLNYQAVQLIDQGALPGTAYLNIVRERWSTIPPDSVAAEDDEVSGRFCGLSLQNLFPWLGDVDEMIARVEQNDDACGFECEYESSSGVKSFEGQISRMLDMSDRFVGTLIVLNDITERKMFAKHLEVLATTDALTGVRNRLSFLEKAELEFERARRYRRELSVLAIDADRFKSINDNFGHHVGDKVLKALTATIEGLLRSNDLCGRMGGEEFAVVLPETGCDAASLVAERLCEELRQLVIPADEVKVTVTVSVGVASMNAADEAVEHLLKRADLAMYEAKASGRNRIAAA